LFHLFILIFIGSNIKRRQTAKFKILTSSPNGYDPWIVCGSTPLSLRLVSKLSLTSGNMWMKTVARRTPPPKHMSPAMKCSIHFIPSFLTNLTRSRGPRPLKSLTSPSRISTMTFAPIKSMVMFVFTSKFYLMKLTRRSEKRMNSIN